MNRLRRITASGNSLPLLSHPLHPGPPHSNHDVNTATLQPTWQRDAETIGLIGLAHGTSHFFHLLLPPLFPALMSQFGLSFTQCGLLTTVFFLVSGVGQAL